MSSINSVCVTWNCVQVTHVWVLGLRAAHLVRGSG